MEYNWKDVEVSRDLKEFLKYVKKVLDSRDDIKECNFRFESGLCTNLLRYFKYEIKKLRDVTIELENIFIVNGLSEIYPFDSGCEHHYEAGLICCTLYNNPMRLSFIEFYGK